MPKSSNDCFTLSFDPKVVFGITVTPILPVFLSLFTVSSLNVLGTLPDSFLIFFFFCVGFVPESLVQAGSRRQCLGTDSCVDSRIDSGPDRSKAESVSEESGGRAIVILMGSSYPG